MKNSLIVIVGPTGVGKTATSLLIAEHYGCSIINADSRQLYRALPIGTAAPTVAEKRRVRHYFAGTLELDDYYSASIFEQSVTQLLTSQAITVAVPSARKLRSLILGYVLSGSSSMIWKSVFPSS